MQFEINDILAQGGNQIKTLTYAFEDIQELRLELLNADDLRRFGQLGCNKRKAEFFFTRLLWQHFDGYQPIKYNENGKPNIQNGHLSISHSKNIVAISFSRDHEVGVDVEHFNPKIRKIKNKFTSQTESKLVDLNNDEVLTTIWSIKEATYKMVGIPGLSFKNAMTVKTIGKKNTILVTIPNGTTVPYEFFRIIYDDYILTYCNVRKTKTA